jgi:oligopeptide transport system substrate-binding protein
MNTRRSLIALVIMLAAALLLTGCPSNATPSTTTSTSATPTPTRTVPPAHGTLNLAGTDPYTLDPALAADANSHLFVTEIFSGLVRFDESLEVVPDLAASWDVSQDRLTYTFHLRRDAVFQDGRAVTAADVVYSWERACDPATGSTVAATYLGDIAGVLDKLAGNASSISGLAAPDDHTVRVTITAPISYFLAKLTYPTSFVVDKDNAAQGAAWYRQPNGTGPFSLAEWTQGQSLTLARNTQYYGQIATLESVHFLFLSGIPMNQYEAGDIDVAGVSTVYIDRVQDPDGPFYGQLRVTPQLSFSFIGFNATKEPFDDVHVRRAFTYALDKDKIISVMFRGLVQKAEGILPPGIPGYNPDLTGLGYDVAKAKQELALSRYGSAENLPSITITSAGYGGTVSPLLAAAAVQWRDNLGVEVTIRQMEPERYYYNLTAEKDEMFDMGWIADYPSPQNFLDVLFHTGAENNFGEYSNAAIDAILDRAAAADEAEALELYRQAEQRLVDDAACLPFSFGENYILVKPYVQGYDVNPMGLVRLNRVSLSN